MATSSIQAANLFSVNGLVAVITGGGSGIGLMMARALALNGAHKIYIVGRRKEVLEEAAKSVSTNNIIPLVGDVTSKESIASIASHIKAETGYINLLIANSGVGGPQASKPVSAETSIEEFAEMYGGPSFEDTTRTFEVNTVAVLMCVTAFLPLLDAGNKKGNLEQQSQIIATTSVGGLHRKITAGFAYGASKAATTHLIKQMATQLTQWSIRANAIAPGLFPSELAAPVIGDGVFPKEMIPMQRMGTEEDMAGCILWLASKAGAYISGNVVVIDGGRISVLPSTY